MDSMLQLHQPVETGVSPSLMKTSSAQITSNQVRRVRDVYTAPPTELLVSDGVHSVIANPDGSFTIPASWVEVTEGWLRKDGAHQLSICFMHSFGKCSGRCNNDPSTCHQIHLPLVQLQQIRQLYTHPQRNFFSRTVKAKLPTALRQMLVTHLRRSTVSLAYLEYYAHDVQPTTGYHAYEEEYGRWLRSSGVSSFESTSTEQCVEFALTAQCRVGLGCRFVHAPLTKALTRDKGVMAALQAMEFQGSQLSGAPTTAEIIPATAVQPTNTFRFASFAAPHATNVYAAGIEQHPAFGPTSHSHTHTTTVPQAALPQQSVVWSPVVFPPSHHDQSHAFNNYHPNPMPSAHQPMMVPQQHPPTSYHPHPSGSGMLPVHHQPTTAWGTAPFSAAYPPHPQQAPPTPPQQQGDARSMMQGQQQPALHFIQVMQHPQQQHNGSNTAGAVGPWQIG